MTHTIAPEENWEFYVYPTEDGPVFVTFHTEIEAIPKETFSHCARVIIPMKDKDEYGAATDAEANALYDLEDTLVTVLTQADVKCHLLARVTHAGNRELVFQLADWDSFRTPARLWLDTHPTYEIDVSEQEGWTFFDDCVWPSDDDWIWIYDRRVVDGLIEHGSDPEKTHDLEFTFGGETDALTSTKPALEKRGYTQLSFDEAANSLVMVKTMTLDVNLIWEESMANLELAKTNTISYDGWGAVPVE